MEDQAAFYGLTPSTYSRLVAGKQQPGSTVIALVVTSHPEDERVSFDGLFYIAETAA